MNSSMRQSKHSVFMCADEQQYVRQSKHSVFMCADEQQYVKRLNLLTSAVAFASLIHRLMYFLYLRCISNMTFSDSKTENNTRQM